MRQLGEQELEDLLNGAAFLASGGGGSRQMGEEILQAILAKSETVTLLDFQEVEQPQWGVVPFAAGAPSDVHPQQARSFLSLHFSLSHFSREKPETGRNYTLSDLLAAAIAPVELVEEIIGENFSFVLPIEIGTANTFLAMFIAVSQNIAIVNGDGAGRSVPSLEMLTYSHSDLPVYPGAMASIPSPFDSNNQTKLAIYPNQISTSNDLMIQTMQTEEFGNAGVMASYVMTGETLQNLCPIVPNTISLALEIGSVLRQATEQGKNPITALLGYFDENPALPNAFLLGEGEIVDIKKENVGRLDKLEVIVATDKGEICISGFNENLVAYCNNSHEVPLAIGPDLICYLTPDGIALTNEELEKGIYLGIIGLQAPEESQQPTVIQGYREGITQLGYAPYIPIQYLLNSFDPWRC
ncbi:DUF917 domain-containing protein [Oscillatoria salina]|uniref:DUF917 domain-containing protein n=1 Tax=Oscillatoria salina TaxID=331517 RepID=UPI001CCBA4AC|nr:DUF917 domain-containing protein [Oscillatoria salina]MBZ8181535.1 DUF917 domain-containing protein [Oscillatoria salina IIICB1]